MSGFFREVYRPFPRGTFDDLFIFMAKLIDRIRQGGLLLENLGDIEIEDTKANELLLVGLNLLMCAAAWNAHFDLVLDYELTKLIYRNPMLTDFELGEIVMMRKLIPYLNTYYLDDFSALSANICSWQARDIVQNTVRKYVFLK